MSRGPNMDDYVDVAERIRVFYERFPDGRLVTGTPPFVVDIGGKPFIWYHARAYRTPDDPQPGDGWAAEPVPGLTPFTRDSELMNAETAAWGRAIVALGFETKKLASRQEVQGRGATAGLTLAELRSRMTDEQIGAVGKRLFPGRKLRDLTGAEREQIYTSHAAGEAA